MNLVSIDLRPKIIGYVWVEHFKKMAMADSMLTFFMHGPCYFAHYIRFKVQGVVCLS